MEPRTMRIVGMLLCAFGSGVQAIAAWHDNRIAFAVITTAIALGALVVALTLQRTATK